MVSGVWYFLAGLALGIVISVRFPNLGSSLKHAFSNASNQKIDNYTNPKAITGVG